jgi:glycyl-tRNA synthetase beta chain
MNELAPATLLVELGCEELPPKTLDRLSSAFFEGVCARLEKAGIDFERESSRALHSPRRLALQLKATTARQADREIERRGPALQAAFDEDGKPTAAAEGFARSVGCEVSELETLSTEKGEWLSFRATEPGQDLADVLFPIMEQVLDQLPVARPMRWSDHDFSFVRPVHWLVVLHGDRVLPGKLYGQAAGRRSHGHRVHHPEPIEVAHADDYLEQLEAARVLADPSRRREKIRQAVASAGHEAGGEARISDDLLSEVNNLVEWPTPVTCSFDESFLAVPQEALIASMEDHQKFFPVLDLDDGRLRPQFIAVANLESTDTSAVRAGYERVIRPRLADAQFFWNQDRKVPVEDSLKALSGVVFQSKLGSVKDKSNRISVISMKIAELSSRDPESAGRAARLSKFDLVSQMVGEFPELQGIMGGYYAEAAGEPSAVAAAISEHYLPRFSGDLLPPSDLGVIVALADRLDTLVGVFAAGLKPTGNKDPFALRRAALGVVRLLTETGLSPELDRLLAISANALAESIEVRPETLGEVRGFVLDRVRQHYRDQAIDTRLVDAALAAPLTTLADLDSRLHALAQFMQLPEAEALVAANKRIGNILRKSQEEAFSEIEVNRLVLAEEKALFDEVTKLESSLPEQFEHGEYAAGLTSLACLQAVVDGFFDGVMVMDEDILIRNNRLALLARLKALFDRVADLSLAG